MLKLKDLIIIKITIIIIIIMIIHIILKLRQRGFASIPGQYFMAPRRM